MTKFEEIQHQIDYSEKERYQGESYWMLCWESDYKERTMHLRENPYRFKPYGYLDRMLKFNLMEGYKRGL